jgi:fermentation-respiration switch protein FrsA (DUF1100 family)
VAASRYALCNAATELRVKAVAAVGSTADTLFWSRDVYEKAREPKELHVIEGATHIDMYDRPQFVTPAVGKLTGFFGRHLADAGGSK